MERKIRSYTLHYAGLFGRNRKPKVASTNLAEVPLADGPLPEAKVRELMSAKLKEIKPKGALNVAVVESEETIEERDMGGVMMVLRTFALYAGKTLFKETVAA